MLQIIVEPIVFWEVKKIIELVKTELYCIDKAGEIKPFGSNYKN